jgi:hypothetical protein
MKLHKFPVEALIALASVVALQSTFSADVPGDRLNIGTGHTLSGSWSTIAGGSNNTANADFASVLEGHDNAATARNSTVVSGVRNSVSATNSAIVSGRDNTNRGFFCFIGGGFENFVTNWGSVIAGGKNNNVRDSYSAIGAGFNNVIGGVTGGNFIAGGSYNTNLSQYSFIGSGFSNVITDAGGSFGHAILGGAANFVSTTKPSSIGGGQLNAIKDYAYYSWIGGGSQNTNTAAYANIAGGELNYIDGDEVDGPYATIGGGQENYVFANYGTIPGGYEAKATHYGQFAYASGEFSAKGDAQMSMYVLRKETNVATQIELFLDNAGSRMSVPTNATWTFEIQVAARSTASTSAGYLMKGVIENISGTTSFIGTPTIETLGEDAASWDATVVADNTNDALAIKVTGATSTTIRWVATVRTTEVMNP